MRYCVFPISEGYTKAFSLADCDQNDARNERAGPFTLSDAILQLIVSPDSVGISYVQCVGHISKWNGLACLLFSEIQGVRLSRIIMVRSGAWFSNRSFSSTVSMSALAVVSVAL